MKFKMRLLLILPMMFAANVSLADEVDNGTRGGGNHELTPSTESEVQDAIQTVQNYFREQVSYSMGHALFDDIKFVVDPVLQDNLKLVFSRPQYEVPTVLAKEFLISKIVPQIPPCRSDGEDKDSSTEFHSGAPICMSISRLTLVPLVALTNQISSLLVHELSHHLGVTDEDIAKRIGRYYAREVGFNINIEGGRALKRAHMQWGYFWYKEAIKHFLESSDGGTVCRQDRMDNIKDNPIHFPTFFENKAAVDDLVKTHLEPVRQSLREKIQKYCSNQMSKRQLNEYVKVTYSPAVEAIYQRGLELYKIRY